MALTTAEKRNICGLGFIGTGRRGRKKNILKSFIQNILFIVRNVKSLIFLRYLREIH